MSDGAQEGSVPADGDAPAFEDAAVEDVAADGDAAFDDDADRVRVRREIAVLTGLGVLLIAVFGPIAYSQRWVDDQVYDATVVAPTELQLAVDGCWADRRVRVVERDDEIEVRVQHRGSGGDGGCIESVSARLDAPLGDRRVVDASDGVSIPVCDSAGSFADCATR